MRVRRSTSERGERGERGEHGEHGGRRRRRGLGLLLATLVMAGCGFVPSDPAPPDSSIAAGIAAAGFPVGTYSKVFEDPPGRRVRLAWTFGPDGRWAEVPTALDGQTLPGGPIRGTYRIDGDRLTIATNYPPDFGTSEHTWRIEGSSLWTTFVSSELEGDQEWFAMLDPMPWVPLE